MILAKGDSKHKYYAVFPDGKRMGFGSPTSTTYTEGATDKQKENYLKRHKVRENWTKRSPGALSRWVLWSDKDVKKGVSNYNRNVR